MPRQNRRLPDRSEPPDEVDGEQIGRGAPRRESGPDGDWLVRPVTGAAATKSYRCPGCDQEVRPGTAHVVVWPEDPVSGTERRRHWHTPCWNARARRPPRVTRSRNAPRY